MVSVFVGAAALTAAVAGGYGLYRYWSRTDSLELSPKRPISSPPVAPKPSLSSREEVIQSPEVVADKSPPPVAPKPSSGLRNRRVITPSPVKLTFAQPSPLQTIQGDRPATFDEPPHRAALSSPLRNKGPSNRRPPTRHRN